ncbi:MAG: histidinol dehydrogenase [Mycobacteriales bacterium]
MQINRYVWNDTPQEQRERVLARVQANFDSITDVVQGIIDEVRTDGDAALVRYAAKLDGVTLEPDALRVTAAEFDAAEQEVGPELRGAMQDAHDSIVTHHREQLPVESWMKEIGPGVLSGERVTPITSVGLYVPRGKGSFPSVMLMLCTPAVLAGVPYIAVCTPPGPDGSIDAASLVAAQICGIDIVYKVGGAQAMAALAYGTESIRRVEKIVGPGNQYVSAAKRLLYGVVDPGPPAGPSESIVLADATADPEIVAREWLVEAEHGPDSAALLVTDSPRLADAVEAIVPGLVAKLPDQRRSFVETVLAGYGGVVLTEDMAEAIEFVNDYAPEHLRVIAVAPFELLPKLVNAGEILLGDYTSIPFGNFSIGLNAILPTGGNARSHSCVSLHTFLKQSSFAYVSAEGARRIGPTAIALAQWEGFPAHEAAAQHAVDRAGRG